MVRTTGALYAVLKGFNRWMNHSRCCGGVSGYSAIAATLRQLRCGKFEACPNPGDVYCAARTKRAHHFVGRHTGDAIEEGLDGKGLWLHPAGLHGRLCREFIGVAENVEHQDVEIFEVFTDVHESSDVGPLR